MTDEKIEPKVIDELCAIRDRINLEIQDMTKEELLAYLNKQETLHSKEFWKEKLA